jgi:hypothetical protein
MKLRTILILIVTAACVQTAGSSGAAFYQVLIPAGRTMNNLAVLKPLPPEDSRYAKAAFLFDSTFIRASVMLYQDLQHYLVSAGDSRPIEPAYLLLSGRQGGFPVKGFYLEENGVVEDKSSTWYVDLQDLDKDAATLNSITQIFPHEMGHVFFALLAPEAQKDFQPWSVDIHYFSMTTNVLTAFNEGFAEHFENASRLYEPDATIRAGTERQTLQLSSSLPHRLAGLERDFRWPLRLDYYRAGLLLWYQNFENFKRYRWAIDSATWLQNKHLHSGDPEKSILFRNTGLAYDHTRVRNTAQAAANEGTINGFFTRLLQRFAHDREDSLRVYYHRLFSVMHEQMNHPPGDTSFLQLFVLAWGRQFPEDTVPIRNIYLASFGRPFDPNPIPELWVKNEEFRHSFLVMDQYGGAIIPFYTLNLNTAEECDLVTFPAISQGEAEAIVRFRDQQGGFTTLSGLSKVPGLSAGALQALIHGHELTLKSQEGDTERGLSILHILLVNGGHILLTGLWYFLIFLVVFFFLFLRKGYNIPQILLIFLQKFLKLYLLILAGLACFMFIQTPVWPFLLIVAGLLATDWLKTRKRPVKRKEVLFTTLLMGIMVIYSLL